MEHGELDEVKVGDLVGVRTGWVSTGWHSGFPVIKPATVGDVTAREVAVLGQRFSRRNGLEVGKGGDYYNERTSRIEGLWTPELQAEAAKYDHLIVEHRRHKQLLATIGAVDFKTLPLATLEAVVTLLTVEQEVM